MKGWGANVGRDIRECKKALLESIETLDLRTDGVGLSAEEWMLIYDLKDKLIVIYIDEEEYWCLRGTQNWVLKGDASTAYSHATANGRQRCNSIPLLWDGETLLQ